MIDEKSMRNAYPEIPWDQPAEIFVAGHGNEPFYVCRYCIALHGVSAQLLMRGGVSFAHTDREAALEHIEELHHE